MPSAEPGGITSIVQRGHDQARWPRHSRNMAEIPEFTVRFSSTESL